MCTPFSGLGLLNKATGGSIRPLAFASPALALATGGLTKKKSGNVPMSAG
jgi:hypothetical protein